MYNIIFEYIEKDNITIEKDFYLKQIIIKNDNYKMRYFGYNKKQALKNFKKLYNIK